MFASKSLLLALCFHFAWSITNDDLYPSIGPDGQFKTLPQDSEDASSSEIQLKVPIVFYGEVYKSLFVNSNGHISFLTEIPSFSNVKFPLRFPVIAPLYTDVDIRGSGKVYYRETSEPNLIKRAKLEIQPNFRAYKSFEPTSLFIVTWDKVGYYERGIDKVNTFQVMVASNGSNSFAQFLFPENGIQWIQSSGKNPNYPDARAQSGFIAESGDFFELEDSGTDQVTNLEILSNTPQPGNWIFHIGGTGSTKLTPADGVTGDITVETKSQAQANCASVGKTQCHLNAKCIDYTEGICCECKKGFVGNGKHCIKANEPLRVTGKMNGLLNGIKIKDFDLHAYVLTKTGRTFTAISKAPSTLGHEMLNLPVIGTVFGWMFALADPDAKNGYQIAGGVFNRSVEVEFPLTGDHVSIKQYFTGLDAFGYLEVRTDITGSTPGVAEGTKLNMKDYDVHYTKVRPGVIQMHLKNEYQVKDTGIRTRFVVDETIAFKECEHGPKNEKLDSLRMRTARNYLIYDKNEEIVRFAMTNRITVMSRENPCRGIQCKADSSCVVSRNSYKCVCNQGYELSYEISNDGICTDINECTTGRHNCHVDAQCLNQRGSFNCICKPGYSGDGLKCEKMLTCADLNCNIDATCLLKQDGSPECICKAGYTGDGYVCQKEETQLDCRRTKYCDVNARCTYVEETRRAICQCNRGYSGDGSSCQLTATKTCSEMACDANANCRYTPENQPECVCNYGYVGDGYVCNRDTSGNACAQLRCDPNADCVYDQTKQQAVCECKTGFSGDGTRCETTATKTCSEMVCDTNANCRYTPENQPECVCNYGYVGDGYVCNRDTKTATKTCSDMACDTNANCRYTPENQPECVCNYGYVGDGYVCNRDTSGNACAQLRCDPNADCVYDQAKQQAVCECKTGFSGDGTRCEKTATKTCSDMACDTNANCRYTPENQPDCVCNYGYVGDGYVCNRDTSGNACAQLRCDPNADCVYDQAKQQAVCKCKTGYSGDGTRCEVTATRTCSQMTCDANANCRYTAENQPECVCNYGYVGDGYVCSRDESGNVCAQLRCDQNADCVYDQTRQQAVCECKKGFYGDGTRCERRSCEQLNCDANAACHFTQDGQPECICNAGYSGDGYVCQKDQVHIDCRRVNNCDANADCVYNYEKNWAECRCRTGFTGDGLQCQASKKSCDELSCNANATCHFTRDGTPECICNSGFVGNGYICEKEEQKEDCLEVDYCDVNADCIRSEATQSNECQCKAGYRGDGVICIREQAHCENCDLNAECRPNPEQTAYECVCKPGFVDDGQKCTKKELSCNVLNRCHAHAECKYNDVTIEFECQCNAGYEGDGYQCTATADGASCGSGGRCSRHAECVFELLSFGYVCRCNEGYAGDGYLCKPLDECNSVDDCDFNAQCMFDEPSSRYVCLCSQGYVGDGKYCQIDPNAGCDVLKDCHGDATCVYDSQNQVHRCQCNQGYVGDGLDCTAEVKACNVVNNCDLNADCVYSPQGYRCLCKPGFRGNGFTCITTRNCAEEPRLCHSNADCLLREDINQYVCHCRAGFTGDGSICRAVPSGESEFLLFNQGMSILKMPITTAAQPKGELIVMEALQTAVGIDVDCYNGFVYWTDVAQAKIKRSRYNGSDVEVFFEEGLKSPEGIAVDWVSGNIYWTDSLKDTIETISIEGKHRRVLISDNLKNPRGIAVHPSREKLYWSDWYRDNPKIEYSNLDGTDRKLLISAGLGLPNALAIDYTREELCWADAGEQRIECMGMRNGRRSTIASPVTYPFGLATYQDIFYWTDWKEKYIHKLKRGETEAEKLKLPLGGNGKLYSITVVPKQCPRGSNACAIQNGGCQFLCLPNGQGSRTCSCPDEAKTSNSSEYAVCNEITN